MLDWYIGCTRISTWVLIYEDENIGPVRYGLLIVYTAVETMLPLVCENCIFGLILSDVTGK